MDSSILISITAAVSEKLFKVFAESWSQSKNKDKKQVKVESWLNNNYDKLREAVTDKSVHLLARAEYGDGLTITSARKLLHPHLSLPPGKLRLFDKEFHYRLEYLVLLGLFQRGMREYHITRLGAAFLAMARTKGHYGPVLKRND